MPCCPPEGTSSPIAPSTWMPCGSWSGAGLGDRRHLRARSQPCCQRAPIGGPVARSQGPIGSRLAGGGLGRPGRTPRVHHLTAAGRWSLVQRYVTVGLGPLGLGYLRPAGPLRGGDAGQRPHRERRRWLRCGLPERSVRSRSQVSADVDTSSRGWARPSSR